MSDGDLISSLYPPPPPYYKYFTEENLNKLDAWVSAETTRQGDKEEVKEEVKEEEDDIKEEEEEEEDKDINKDVKDINEDKYINKDKDKSPPGELKFLVPPTTPSGTNYRGYGNIWSFEDKLPSLKESNWEQLYQDDDESITSEIKIKELHKLMDSLLLNFLELVGIISIDPGQFEGKVKDLSLILININHLLNTYRPHQSRESLIMLLKKQIESKRAEIAKIETVTKDIKEKIIKLTDIDELNNVNELEVEAEKETEDIKEDVIRKLLNELVT